MNRERAPGAAATAHRGNSQDRSEGPPYSANPARCHLACAGTLQAALDLAGLGLSVIPVGAGPDRKRPLARWSEHQQRRATDAEIRDWFSQWPDAGVGIVTGPISGIVVIDIDPRHGGDVTWRDMIWRHGSPEHTWSVQTPSRGMHHYFRMPPGAPWRNTAGDIGPGIDTRAAGGCITCPPTVRPDGRRYVWAAGGCPWNVSLDEPAAELADPPPWLAQMLNGVEARRTARPAPPSSPAPHVTVRTAYVRAALTREIEAVRSATDGNRNATLNRASYSLGRFVASGELSGDATAAALYHAAMAVGLESRQAAATIASGLNAAARGSAA